MQLGRVLAQYARGPEFKFQVLHKPRTVVYVLCNPRDGAVQLRAQPLMRGTVTGVQTCALPICRNLKTNLSHMRDFLESIFK